MGKQSAMSVDEMCEYRRCGGKGGREVARPWRAWTNVEFRGRRMRVCESCASFFKRDRAARGGSGSTQEGGPQQLRDIMREMLLAPIEYWTLHRLKMGHATAGCV